MTRQDLITATLADPDAIWAVLTSGVKVAGPWERGEEKFGSLSSRPGELFPVRPVSVRNSPSLDGGACCECGAGTNVCGIAEVEGRWHVYDLPFGMEAKRVRVVGSFWSFFSADTREAAEAWCDQKLREAGWLLATVEVQGG